MTSFEQLIVWLRWAGISLVLGALCVVSYFAWNFFPAVDNGFDDTMHSSVMEYMQDIRFESLGSGSLALKCDKLSIPFPNLDDEIVLLGRNDRPDHHKDFSRLLLGLKRSGETHALEGGETLFLDVEGDRISFSEEKRPIWIIPEPSGDGMLLKAGIDLGQGMQDEKSFHFDPPSGSNESLVFSEDVFDQAVTSFERAKVFGPDHLLELYGGDRYSDLKRKPRFVFPGEKFLFLFQGDALCFVDGEWRLSELGEVSRAQPLCVVDQVTGSEVVCKLWNVEGFVNREVRLPLEHPHAFSFSLEEVFARIRPRTLHSASCRLAGKSTILREGDWVLRVGDNWKILKSAKEIEQLLAYRIEGDLFVFDGVKKVEGQSCFMGHLFDETRSLMDVVRIPLADRKKANATELAADMDEFSTFDSDFDEDYDEDWDFFDEVY